MKLEDNVSKEIIHYTEVYWAPDRPHARRKVLDAMFLKPSSGFEWTEHGYLINEERDVFTANRSPRYGNLTAKLFVDMAWLEEQKVKGRRGAWIPSPISEDSNLFRIPENIQPDYLEAAYEIAQQAYLYLKTNDLSEYPTRVSQEQIQEWHDLVHDGDIDYDAPTRYHMSHEDGELTMEWAINYEEEKFASKIRRMCYSLEDFFEIYRGIKAKQKPITVYLDDNRPTPKEFDVHIYTTKHCIELLEFGNVTMMSLDNDLGPYSPEEGYKVANHVEEQAFHGKIKKLAVHVHSANTVREKEIVRSISQANKFWKNVQTV
ncbi:MAG: hypothetical protein P8J32_09230 [bacterium]|nr:hypothetical protein [bacterium]